MNNQIIILLTLLTTISFSCKTRNSSSPELMKYSRQQLEDIAMNNGWTLRDERIIKEYDKLSNLTSTPELIESISESKLLKKEQKSFLVNMVSSETKLIGDVINLALLNAYIQNIYDYRIPVDVCLVELSDEGILDVNFLNSALTSSLKFTTSSENFEKGLLEEKHYPYGTTDFQIPNLTEGDSVFGYFSFMYFNTEDLEVPFKGQFKGKSR